MEIKRSMIKHGNLVPSAWNVLCALRGESLHHGSHEILHPKAAYGGSLRQIFDQWKSVLDELDLLVMEQRFKNQDSRLAELMLKYRELLYRLNEHFDACMVVLRSLFPPIHGNEKRWHRDFLNQQHSRSWIRFEQALSEYKGKRLGAIVNALKHDGAVLRGMYFYGQGEFRPGYFLCVVGKCGTLMPSAKVHSGGNSGFSLVRDMLIHLWWIYKTGDLLSEAVAQIADEDAFAFEQAPRNDFPHESWHSTIRRIADLRYEIFPDERSLPIPRLEIPSDGRDLTLRMLSRCPRVTFPSYLRILVHTHVDFEHRSQKLPYFGEDSSGTADRR